MTSRKFSACAACHCDPCACHLPRPKVASEAHAVRAADHARALLAMWDSVDVPAHAALAAERERRNPDGNIYGVVHAFLSGVVARAEGGADAG